MIFFAKNTTYFQFEANENVNHKCFLAGSIQIIRYTLARNRYFSLRVIPINFKPRHLTMNISLCYLFLKSDTTA